MSTQAFGAGFSRFCSQRGSPSVVFSDNGRNFVGADHEMKKAIQQMLSSLSIDYIMQYASAYSIDWRFSPSSAPHFGGLWEAGVRAMKGILRKTVGTHSLSFEELTTILPEVESILNSRPLTAPDSLPADGDIILTPGHFLIGRPLRTPPVPVDIASKMTLLKGWNLMRRLIHDLWIHWSKLYLQTLQARNKWMKVRPNLQVGDIVILKDSTFQKPTWPLARVEKTFPGPDSLVRVVDVYCASKTYRRPVHELVLLVPANEEQLSAGGGCSGLPSQ